MAPDAEFEQGVTLEQSVTFEQSVTCTMNHHRSRKVRKKHHRSGGIVEISSVDPVDLYNESSSVLDCAVAEAQNQANSGGQRRRFRNRNGAH